mgnify:CR=1 FL=1
MGTGDIGLPSLRALIARASTDVVATVTQPDRPAGRGRKLQAPAVKEIALEAGIPVLQPERLRNEEAVAQLRELSPDLIVVMAYGQILPKSVLEIPKTACINLHASLLPRHRGAAPIQAAILAGDAETGITVMHMAEGLDTGDMILAKRIPIRRRETAGTLHDRLADLAASALEEALDQFEQGTARREPQDDAVATYAGRLNREDGRIDWNRDACAIERHIRAMNPWPSAFCEMPLRDGGPARLKVHSAIVHRREGGPAGQVLRADEAGILVGAGGGSVLLRTIQGEGGRRMTAGEWIRGHAVAIGAVCT